MNEVSHTRTNFYYDGTLDLKPYSVSRTLSLCRTLSLLRTFSLLCRSRLDECMTECAQHMSLLTCTGLFHMSLLTFAGLFHMSLVTFTGLVWMNAWQNGHSICLFWHIQVSFICLFLVVSFGWMHVKMSKAQGNIYKGCVYTPLGYIHMHRHT